MRDNNFDGKTCWITGASSGIGAALAQALNQQGAITIISARNKKKLDELKRKCLFPDKIIVLSCDMEKINSLPDITKQAWQFSDGIDYAFLNAGISVRDFFINIEFEYIKKVMNVNFFGAVIITKTLLPLMIKRGSGHFVITSSLSGKYGIPKLSAYAASKHALHGLFESLRAEYEKDKIGISMVIPGLIRTHISENALMGDGSVSGKMQESIAAGISPEKCAIGILKGVIKNKNYIVVGGPEKFTIFINRLSPELMSFIIRSHPLKKLRKWGFVN